MFRPFLAVVGGFTLLGAVPMLLSAKSFSGVAFTVGLIVVYLASIYSVLLAARSMDQFQPTEKVAFKWRALAGGLAFFGISYMFAGFLKSEDAFPVGFLLSIAIVLWSLPRVGLKLGCYAMKTDVKSDAQEAESVA